MRPEQEDRDHPGFRRNPGFSLPTGVLAALALLGAPCEAQQIFTWAHLAGAGGRGYYDGPGPTARAANPAGVARDAAGNTYVADTGNHTIRKIDAAGNVTTLAGLAGTPGFADGRGGGARFYSPARLAVSPAGVVYVADVLNHRIRKIDAAGRVSTLAGNGTGGFADGPGASAMLRYPSGVAVDAAGIVYVADTHNDRIRKIDTAGNVSTLAGDGYRDFADGPGASARFALPSGVAVDSSGVVYVADAANHRIRMIDAAGNVSTLAGNGTEGFAEGPGPSARFALPSGVAVDGAGIVHVADTYNDRIRTIDAAGNVSTLAGSGFYGFADGPGASARFRLPTGIAVDASGTVYVADSTSHLIRRIDSSGEVSTPLGNGFYGFADGPGASAMFEAPSGVAVDSSGVSYVADSSNHRIRKIDSAGEVSTLAGDGIEGFADGPGASARFASPRDVAVDTSGIVYVADSSNHRIRMIDTAGNVSTLAGSGTMGFADGPGASAMLASPRGVSVAPSGIVYVADSSNHRIRMIDTAGNVSTLAGSGTMGFADGPGASARFAHPIGVAVDTAGIVYVADSDNHRIRTIDTAGNVSTLAGDGSYGFADGPGASARFRRPRGVAIDSSGITYVADTESHRIRAIDTAGSVTTIGGSSSPGDLDGTGSVAGFFAPAGLAVDPSRSRVIVADADIGVIRAGEPALPDEATIDATSGPPLVTRQLDTSPQTATSWKWELVRRPSHSTAELSSTTVRNPTFTPDVPDVYVFRLTAKDDAGATSITLVTLTAMQVSSFTATPAVRTSAGASTLAWTTTGATGVAISGLGGTFALSGTRDVSVAATTTYTLTATNAAGSVTATATVNVLPGAGTSLGTPVITAPSAGQTVTVAGVGFAWNAVSSAAGYDVKLYSSTNGATVFAGSLVGNASTSTLVTLPDGAYLFAVRACNASGFANSNCGAFATRSFSVVKTAPTGAPTVTAPAQGAVLTASTQTFSWTSVPKADPGLSLSYEVLLTDVAGGNIPDLQITVPDPTLSTIYTLHSSALYELKVRACQAGCGPWSAPVTFSVDLPDVPTTAPSIPTCSVSGGNSLACSWSAVSGADVYSFYVVQPTGGPGGGALTVAARLVSETTVTLPVPQGFANVIVAACTGDGCGPYSGARGINPAGPNPSSPNLGTPLAASVVNGPGVEFSWSRIPGDDGTNTWYRLYVQDLSRQAAALDVYTRDNFYAAYFKAEGARYDALVVANPGASQVVGPPIGFNVRGLSSSAPTMVSPPHQSQVLAGNLQLGWSPVPGATLYQYWVAVLGQGTPAVTGVTPGLVVQVPLPAVVGQPTTYSGITRACMSPAECSATDERGWGPWSDAPGGPGVTNFTVTP